MFDPDFDFKPDLGILRCNDCGGRMIQITYEPHIEHECEDCGERGN